MNYTISKLFHLKLHTGTFSDIEVKSNKKKLKRVLSVTYLTYKQLLAYNTFDPNLEAMAVLLFASHGLLSVNCFGVPKIKDLGNCFGLIVWECKFKWEKYYSATTILLYLI